MDAGKSEKKRNVNTVALLFAAVFLGILVMSISEDICLRVTLVGREGLRNAAAVLSVYLLGLAIEAGAFIYGGVKAFTYGVKLGRAYRLADSETERAMSAYFGKHLPALVKIIGVILIGMGGISLTAGTDSGGAMYTHMWKNGGNNISLLADVLCDMRDEKVRSYRVNDGYSIDFSDGYAAYFGYEDDTVWAPELFAVQIGGVDRGYIRDSLPGKISAQAYVYERSGLLMSIVPDRDVSGYEGYTYLYKIFVDDDTISYEYMGSGEEPDNLSWCGFKSGERGDIRNSLFSINAAGDRACLDVGFGDLCSEICLFAWIDGGYTQVSNVIDFGEGAE